MSLLGELRNERLTNQFAFLRGYAGRGTFFIVYGSTVVMVTLFAAPIVIGSLTIVTGITQTVVSCLGVVEEEDEAAGGEALSSLCRLVRVRMCVFPLSSRFTLHSLTVALSTFARRQRGGQ